jgi:5-methyltetrahydrofolate--homocysteine methyltransferase
MNAGAGAHSGTGELTASLCQAILDFDSDETLRLSLARLDAGEAPALIIDDCRAAMKIVGDRYATGEYFLAELILAGEIFKRVVELLRPRLQLAGAGDSQGTVVLATLRGDVHYIGKDIFATLLEAAGFTVHNLGVDVSPARVVAAARAVDAEFVGFSGLLTTTFEVMKEATGLLRGAGSGEAPRILIGGGVTTSDVRDYVGADFQTRDAMEGVAWCRQVAQRMRRGQ